MTDIIECENLLKQHKSKLMRYYPTIVDYLENFSSKDNFLSRINSALSPARREFYNLYGYPEQLAEDEQNDTIKVNWIRIHNYPEKETFNCDNDRIFIEYCINKQMSNLPDLGDKTPPSVLQLKYLQAEDEETSNAIADTMEQRGIFTNDIKFLKLHRTALTTSTSLDELEKRFKYTDPHLPENIWAWKRMRSIIKQYMNCKIESITEMLGRIKGMKLVDAKEVFHNVEHDEHALEELNKLIAILPYKDKDKEDILNAVNNYMEKDLVQILPQYKDKWFNGRLVFEIGDDADDLFKLYKGIMGTQYFVLTVNPVDILFCSTDQEYTSCFSLESPHGSVQGLPNFLSRPDIAMCFLSSGSMSKPWKSDSYPGLAINHIKIKARAFIYNNDALNMADIGRCYAPRELTNVGRESLEHFRSDARVMLWKLLMESGCLTQEVFDSLNISNKQFRRYFTDKAFDYDMDFTFGVKPLVLRHYKDTRTSHNEVYFDNLYFDIDDGASEYRSRVGRGCTHRYCGDGPLYNLYKRELENKGVDLNGNK